MRAILYRSGTNCIFRYGRCGTLHTCVLPRNKCAREDSGCWQRRISTAAEHINSYLVHGSDSTFERMLITTLAAQPFSTLRYIFQFHKFGVHVYKYLFIFVLRNYTLLQALYYKVQTRQYLVGKFHFKMRSRHFSRLAVRSRFAADYKLQFLAAEGELLAACFAPSLSPVD